MSNRPAEIDFSSELAELPCPDCRTSLVHATAAGAKVIGCPTCRGLFLAGEDFALLVRSLRSAYRGPDVIPHPIDPDQAHPPRECPACAAVMDAHPYAGPGNAVIDACRECRMVWLDHGELQQIVQAPGRR